ncbi:SAM-dependent methyltransferase [Psychromonas marina]|uniref:SAM-dependent methyltransferase n=1 Tax=Psychromonas marina TaxID=88364 RepID=A0ABQ6E2E3_9GAMM|nr:tRNA (adenine(22)-N(1))-methyltransferase TrmK [Psychromonas marina]GLS91141.1 SAM-dependent methyltransferase [Psychromonas marina]
MEEFSKVKLGKRLTAIESIVNDEYDHIWDCCCDHGLLGFQLLEKGKAETQHFVDIVPQLLEQIESKLKRFYRGDKQWQVHCLDVAQLPLLDYPTQKHLIIIAGVGGQLLIDFLSKLLPLSATMNIEFVLSPVHHNYQLRAFLANHQCALIDEFIVAENKRYYEVLHINNSEPHVNAAQISLVGNKMWDFENSDHQNYLQQTLAHYQRMAKNPNTEVDQIISAYQQLIL